MQSIFIVLPMMIFIVIAALFIMRAFNTHGKKDLHVRILPVALVAVAMGLTGVGLFGGVEQLAHIISSTFSRFVGTQSHGFGVFGASSMPGVSALSVALAMGAAAPASDELLTLKELAELDQPFAAETAELFASVRDHDFKTLSARCDDDFGIIDINPEGGSELIRTRAEWENWFTTLFKQLTAMQAKTDTFIAKYDAVNWGETGMSVVEFAQMLEVGGKTGRFNVIVTIVWKKVEDRWIEARWHSSLVSTELPEGFGA